MNRTTEEQKQESRVRSLARRAGYALLRSRRAVGLNNAGDFMVLDAQTRLPVLGFRYDADLSECEEWLRE